MAMELGIKKKPQRTQYSVMQKVKMAEAQRQVGLLPLACPFWWQEDPAKKNQAHGRCPQHWLDSELEKLTGHSKGKEGQGCYLHA